MDKKVFVKYFSLGLIFTISIILSACGSGTGSTDSGGSNNSTPIKTGAFVDSPVEGLQYFTNTLSGFTDNQGKYQYKDGETITFKIGNLTLGSTQSRSLITPLTLTGESDLNNISVIATNIARILQSLDENSSNSGLIKIPAILKDLNVSNIDLEADADLGTILAEAQNLTSKSYILKDSVSAKAQMKKYIQLHNDYKRLEAQYYTETDTTKYYLLSMPASAYIDFGIIRAYLYLYNENLSPLYNGYSISDTKYLTAGTYIVKVKYGSANINASSTGQITIVSNIID